MDKTRLLPVIDAGHVANCGADDCAFNKEHVCRAPNGVSIVFHKDHADCGTYTHNGHKGVT